MQTKKSQKKSELDIIDDAIENAEKLSDLKKGKYIVYYHQGGILSDAEKRICLVIDTNVIKPFSGRQKGIELLDSKGRRFIRSYRELVYPELRFTVATDAEKTEFEEGLSWGKFSKELLSIIVDRWERYTSNKRMLKKATA